MTRNLSTSALVAVFAVLFCRATLAQQRTVGAKGSGQIPAYSCTIDPMMLVVCNTGGQAASFSISFTGTAPLVPNQPVLATGSMDYTDKETGEHVQWVSGNVAISLGFHSVSFNGLCQVTNTIGTFFANCSGNASDAGEPSSADRFELFYSTVGSFGAAVGQLISGQIQIG